MLRRLVDRFRLPPVPLTLYSKPGCGLCDEMKEEIERARVPRRIVLDEVDISGSPELEERYGRSIPVLFIGGRLAFKVRLTAGEFIAKFDRLAAEWDRARLVQGALTDVRTDRGGES